MTEPCQSPDREINGPQDIALYLVDLTEDRDCANTKLGGIRETLDAFDARIAEANAGIAQ